MAAFQALGPFISTFADPAITALLHNQNGEIIITDREQLVDKLNQLEVQRAAESELLAAEKAAAAALTPESSESGIGSEDESSSSNETSNRSNSCIKSELENTLNNNPTCEGSITTPMSGDENSVNNNRVAMDESDEEDRTVNYMSAQVLTGTEQQLQEGGRSWEEKRAMKYYDTRTDNSDYSSFLYWREPVAVLNLVDVDLTTTDDDYTKETGLEIEESKEEEIVLTKLSELGNKDDSTERLETADTKNENKTTEEHEADSAEEQTNLNESSEKEKEETTTDKAEPKDVSGSAGVQDSPGSSEEDEDDGMMPDVETVEREGDASLDGDGNQQQTNFSNSESGKLNILFINHKAIN